MILLTGGTGFLGGYIIKNLVERGLPVRAIRRSSSLPFFPGKEISEKVEWVDGDVLDVVSLDAAMTGVEQVIHSAAIVSFSKQNRKEMYQVNVDGTENVVNIALEKGVRRIVHVSSVAALGRTTKQEMVSETKNWEENSNNTHYAISKHHAEMHVWRGFAEGLEGVIVNPSTILGYGNWHQSSCSIFRNGYRGFPWYTNGINGFVGVEDTSEAIVQLLLSDINHKRFIINAENWSFRELLSAIAESFGKQVPFREASPLMGALAWRMEALRSFFKNEKPLLTRETAKVAQSKTSFSNEALLQSLPGFSYTPLKAVIKNSCEKYEKAVTAGVLTV
jgi:dihydroflavonol-4-reductase